VAFFDGGEKSAMRFECFGCWRTHLCLCGRSVLEVVWCFH
jgi:hypothetical protein